MVNALSIDGTFGHQLINSSTPMTLPAGEFGKFVVPLEDCVVNAATDANLQGGLGWATRTLPQGLTIQGRFTALSLTSGSAIVYFAPLT